MRLVTVSSALLLALSGLGLPASCPCERGQGTERLIPGGAVETDQPAGGRGGQGPWNGERIMERLDANHDGSLTADELSGERRARLLAADTDGDGSVSTEELQSFVQNQMENGAGRGARFQGPGGPEGGPGPGGLLQRLDTNGDGRVELSEIPEQRRERWAAADTNGDGELSSEEIRARAGAGNQRRGGGFGGQPVSPEAMLQRMDENGDGMIQLSEIPERRRERLGAADTDGDGAITLQELTAHMEAMRAQGGPGGPGGPPPEGPGGPPPEGGPGGPPPGDAPPPPPF